MREGCCDKIGGKCSPSRLAENEKPGGRRPLSPERIGRPVIVNHTQRMRWISVKQNSKLAFIPGTGLIEVEPMSNDDRLTVVSFLILARHAATPQERERFFELAEMYKRLAREEATNPGAAPSRRAA